MARDLSGVLDSVLAGIIVLDGTGRVELANAAACRILEQGPDVVSGRPVEKLLGAAHPVATLARAARWSYLPSLPAALFDRLASTSVSASKGFHIWRVRACRSAE